MTTSTNQNPKLVIQNPKLIIPNDLELYPFQIDTVYKSLEFLNSNTHAAYVASEMGLGKSITSIVTANTLNSQKILVLCPSSMRLVWEQEIYKWDHPANTTGNIPKVSVILASLDLTPQVLNISKWIIISYDLSWKATILKLLKTTRFDLLISDEHHYVRHYKAKRTKAFFKHIWPLATQHLLLSGTPVVRCVTDLYLPIVSITPDYPYAANYHLFANRYAYQRKTKWDVDYYGLRKEHVKELSDHIRSNFYIRYEKSQVLEELPPKIFQKIYLDSSYSLELKEAQSKIVQVDATFLLEAINKSAPLHISESLAEHRRLQGELKVSAVVDFALDLLDSNTPIVIFAHHKSVIEAISQALKDYTPSIITGATTPEDRQAAVSDFQEGRTNLFIGNIQAAGTGITLTRASNVLFAELSWLPSEINQATDRCHRIGTKSAVNVYWFVAQLSLDERIADVLMKRAKDFHALCENKETRTISD